MRNLTAALALSVLVALSATLLADPIPYANIGTIAPTTIITANQTGDILGYFVQASAFFTDTVRMVDVTAGTTSSWYFSNQTTPVGTVANFGYVTSGDILVFEIYASNINQTFASDPSYSADGVNHAYVTPFGGGTLYGVDIPAGIYLGMEDKNASNSDFDYNDDTFLFTNNPSKGSSFEKTSGFARSTLTTVTDSATPEPNTLILLGTGLVGLAGALRLRPRNA